MRQIIWLVFYECVHDFEPGDSKRISGTLKPTRLAKFIDRICIGKPVK